MTYKHANTLAKFLGVKQKDFDGKVIESDHETDRERYLVDGVVYDVETVQVRSGGKAKPVQKVYVVVPLDPEARGLGPDNVCPTCGRSRARALRRYEADDAGMARQIHEEHHA